MTPKKPTQVPDGDLSDAVGKHDESEVNRAKHVDESDDRDDKKKDD